MYSIINENEKLNKINNDMNDVAIILQGPIRYENDFTYNTIKFYRSWYPNILIVISTWKGTVKENFKNKCSKFNILILENNLPVGVDNFHINHQLKSTKLAIKKIKNYKNIKYILKARTDQRFYRSDFLIYLKNILKLYPLNSNLLKNRIVFLGSEGTYKRIAFHISDFFSFGKMEDIEKLYGISYECGETNYLYKHKKRWEIIKRIIEKEEYDLNFEVKNKYMLINKFIPPERYIILKFYNKYINKSSDVYSYNLDDYWGFLKKYTIIVDDVMLMFYWDKYEWYKYKIKNKYTRYGGLDSISWLNLVLNYNNKK